MRARDSRCLSTRVGAKRNEALQARISLQPKDTLRLEVDSKESANRNATRVNRASTANNKASINQANKQSSTINRVELVVVIKDYFQLERYHIATRLLFEKRKGILSEVLSEDAQ